MPSRLQKVYWLLFDLAMPQGPPLFLACVIFLLLVLDLVALDGSMASGR